MNVRLVLTAFLWCGLAWLAASGVNAAEPLWKSNLDKNPIADGWLLRSLSDQAPEGGWLEMQGKSGDSCLMVRQGCCGRARRSRLSRCIIISRPSFRRRWKAAVFGWRSLPRRPGAPPSAADSYDSVYASTRWRQQANCFRSPALAAGIRLRFQATEKPLMVKGASIERTDAESVAAWAEKLYATCPLLHYAPPADRWQRLPQTMKTLQDGGKLRIVMLGDSICNDTSNSLYETLLARAYPQTRIEVVTSVRGGTGCWYYQHENRVEDYVLRFQPDLLIIAGISHNFDPEAIRSVIRQVRARSKCEIMVLTGAVGWDENLCRGYIDSCGLPLGEAFRTWRSSPPECRK